MVKAMVESLTQLKPKRLNRRLEELASNALPCVSAVVSHGDPVLSDARRSLAAALA